MSALRPLGDLAGLASLLDDQVVAVHLDDAFDLGFLVAGKNKEKSRLLTYSLVRLEANAEPVCAARVGALAEEDRFSRRRAMALLESRDVFVHFAEEGFVASSPLLPE